MSAYIGPVGQMVEFKCPSASQVQYAERSSFIPTMGGRIVEQRDPAMPRRTWSLDISTATPDQVAALEALYLGAFGAGAWSFLSPDALSVNMLTPAESLLTPGTFATTASVAGPVLADDGFMIPGTILVPAASTVYVGTSVSGLRWGPPVVVGERYTASVYGNGAGGTFSLVFRNAAGGIVGTTESAGMGSARIRRSVSGVAPAGAVDVLLRFNTATTAVRYGAPAITAGPGLVGWGIGRGCRAASVAGFSQALAHAVQGSPGMNRSAYSFTVREVG